MTPLPRSVPYRLGLGYGPLRPWALVALCPSPALFLVWAGPLYGGPSGTVRSAVAPVG